MGNVRPRTTFERSVAEVWAEVLGVPSVGIHDDFFSLGGDSILGAEVVARLRDLTGDEDLPLVSIVRAPTVAGMVHELYGQVSAAERSGPVELHPEARGRAPFFLVHGGDGEVLGFVAFAREVGIERSCGGTARVESTTGSRAAQLMERMAADYVVAMRSVQPEGPYALGGFCLGATVALEMARTLAARGEEISALVLVDPRLPRPRDLRYRLWYLRQGLALVPRRFREGNLLRSAGRHIQRHARTRCRRELDVRDRISDSSFA